MKKLLIATASAAALAAFSGAAPAQAQELEFALVPKNMNNPFFDQARDGCKKAETEAAGKFTCEYIGPGEHGDAGDPVVQCGQAAAGGRVLGEGVVGDGIHESASARAGAVVARARARAGVRDQDFGISVAIMCSM